MSSEGERRFVGEGQLGWMDTLGGKPALFPIAAGLLAISALTASDRFASWAIAAGACVPLWLAWRWRIPQAAWRAITRGRPHFRVELDDLGGRTFDASGKPSSQLEWFEIGSFQATDRGVVLWLRLAKNGANAVFVPRAFFAEGTWPGLLALVRDKLPGAARANDETKERVAIEGRRRAREGALRLGLLVVLFVLLYFYFQEVR